MKFILFVEGKTEKQAVPEFLKQWLDPQLKQPVGIRAVRFEGWAELLRETPTKARLLTAQPKMTSLVSSH
jgi:hypothetical protein